MHSPACRAVYVCASAPRQNRPRMHSLLTQQQTAVLKIHPAAPSTPHLARRNISARSSSLTALPLLGSKSHVRAPSVTPLHLPLVMIHWLRDDARHHATTTMPLLTPHTHIAAAAAPPTGQQHTYSSIPSSCGCTIMHHHVPGARQTQTHTHIHIRGGCIPYETSLTPCRLKLPPPWGANTPHAGLGLLQAGYSCPCPATAVRVRAGLQSTCCWPQTPPSRCSRQVWCPGPPPPCAGPRGLSAPC